jgi:hypothetical protein
MLERRAKARAMTGNQLHLPRRPKPRVTSIRGKMLALCILPASRTRNHLHQMETAKRSRNLGQLKRTPRA